MTEAQNILDAADAHDNRQRITPAVDAFHDHLDVCHQCANNPFGLCGAGAVLLTLAVK